MQRVSWHIFSPLLTPYLSPFDIVNLLHTCKDIYNSSLKRYVHKRWSENLLRIIQRFVPAANLTQNLIIDDEGVLLAAFAPHLKIKRLNLKLIFIKTTTPEFVNNMYVSVRPNYYPRGNVRYMNGKFIVNFEVIEACRTGRMVANSVGSHCGAFEMVMYYDVINSVMHARDYERNFHVFKSRKMLSNGLIECIF
jgi:hypothetical protein